MIEGYWELVLKRGVVSNTLTRIVPPHQFSDINHLKTVLKMIGIKMKPVLSVFVTSVRVLSMHRYCVAVDRKPELKLIVHRF